ncbi:OmpA family protein [Streptomyces sp. CoT10]|uniref:OmpA family protein n=1 Tax=Streptomyces sp. CoT10 TaxID=2875762 RepID=UPI001CD25293|nr:OmpA family protein [Streptomyces sp. CoT10]
MAANRSQLTAPLIALAAAAGLLCTVGGPARQAAATPASSALAINSNALPRIDPRSPGLALRDGAALAPPKVLGLDAPAVDVGQMIEDQEGAERREEVGKEVAFALKAEVLFTKDSARLTNSARSRIVSVARKIEPQPGTTVRVHGFTDNLGSSSHGDALSWRRAIAVQRVLAGELCATAVTFDTRGFGERHPVASNATETGRQQNRRVEITFSRTADGQGSLDGANTP